MHYKCFEKKKGYWRWNLEFKIENEKVTHNCYKNNIWIEILFIKELISVS